jgi:hypothetical protein
VTDRHQRPATRPSPRASNPVSVHARAITPSW